MTRWTEDVTKYCNEIYQNTANIKEAESILDCILTGEQEAITSLLRSPDNVGKDVLLNAISTLNKMHKDTQDCIEEKDELSVRDFVFELKQTVTRIKDDKRIEIDEDLGLEETVGREPSEPLNKRQQLDVSAAAAAPDEGGPSTSVKSPRAEVPSRYDAKSNELFEYIMQKPDISDEAKEDIRRKFSEISRDRSASLGFVGAVN